MALRACGGLIALALAIAACAPAATPSPTPAVTASPASSGAVAPVDSGPPITVLGTENFYADLLEQIGGPRVQASSLLNDPNADPHEFEASPSAARLVADAKLVIVNGIGYDPFMQRLLAASRKPERVVINVQDLLGKKDEDNAHVWFDPTAMPKIAEAATAALAKLDAPNGAFYAAREATYLASLARIDDRVSALRAKHAGAPIAFTEPVAGYLTDAIGLRVLTPAKFQEAIEAGVDPAPVDVATQRDLLTSKKVKVLLYNSQVVTPLTKDLRELAQRNGVPVVGVAETIPPPFTTFQDWQLTLLDELERALAN